jgi:(+)-pinoresinol hydroxylase
VSGHSDRLQQFIAVASAALAGLGALPSGSVARADDEPYVRWTRSTIVAPPRAAVGYVEFHNSCIACHGPMPGSPGTRALAARYHGTRPALLEERTDLTSDGIRTAVRAGINVMPPLRKTELSDRELDAIVAYLTRTRR